MHRYRIVAQISLILSILNLVLAAPIVVREIHEARGDETVVTEDVAAMPEKQHSSLSDGSTSSGYPTPYLSPDSSESGYSWLLDRRPRLSLHDLVSPHLSRPPSLPLLLQGLPSPSYFSSPGSSEMPPSPAQAAALPGSDRAAIETYSPPESPTHSDGLAPSHNSVSDGSRPTETPQDNAKFFNKNMMKKLGIVVGLAVVGGAIGGIVGSQNKHRDCQDS